ncbi:alpha-N-acetylglucosaminidase C-terminal domain-containing protein [Puia sp. P3]|uniref:alpha-N-acetylglucosaminidase C-terminal domain-containing protein n=1 Tax=Puia sp. P3 TaxID=3423952 RepID=UPI003D665299
MRDGAESIVTGRPTLDSTTVWTRTLLNYPPADLLPARDEFVRSAAKIPATEGFRFDLVDLTRQVLANYASVLQKKWVLAFRGDDTVSFDLATAGYLRLIIDLDRLLATQKDFLLGPGSLTHGKKAPHRKNRPSMNAMPATSLPSGVTPTAPSTNTPAGSGVAC